MVGSSQVGKTDRSQFSLSAILVAMVIFSLWLGVVQFFDSPPVAAWVPLVVGIVCYFFRDPCLLIMAPGLMAVVMGFYFHPGGGFRVPPVDWTIFGLTCAVTVVVCSITWTKRKESQRVAAGTQCFVVATAAGIVIGASIGLATWLWGFLLLVCGEIIDPGRTFFVLGPALSALVVAGFVLSMPLGILSGLLCAALPDWAKEDDELEL